MSKMITLTGWESGTPYEVDLTNITKVEWIKEAKATFITKSVPGFNNVTIIYKVKETPEQISAAIKALQREDTQT